jgi:hypothetical protein
MLVPFFTPVPWLPRFTISVGIGVDASTHSLSFRCSGNEAKNNGRHAIAGREPMRLSSMRSLERRRDHFLPGPYVRISEVVRVSGANTTLCAVVHTVV